LEALLITCVFLTDDDPIEVVVEISGYVEIIGDGRRLLEALKDSARRVRPHMAVIIPSHSVKDAQKTILLMASR